MAHDTVLSVQDVAKQYGQKRAVHPLSIDVARGRVVALCGGNGAGKSTLLKMIAGIVPPSQGTICVNDQTYRSARQAYTAAIGYMPDDFLFQQPLTVHEWLTFYAKLRYRDKKSRTAALTDALHTGGLHDKRQEKITNLSKGMRQRLLFAQAIVGNPALLLLDEPTNGLDPYWTSAFIEIVTSLKREQRTILFSTHQLDVAAETADIIFVMHEGKVVERIETGAVATEQLTLQLLQLNRELASPTSK